jgi:peptidoglycan hydrolase-like protein with peptidoglycan-binding domain
MFPPEMTHYKSWVVWRYDHVPNRPKPTKIPYSAITGKKADSTNPDDWATFSQAAAYCKQSNGYFDGIGFVLSEADPFTIIDVDDPDHDVAMQQQALRVLDYFQDTYIERSPSKRGFHIILRGKIANERRRGCIEVYSTKRYFTMTGDTYADNLIIEKDYELMQLWWELGGIAAQIVQLNEGQPAQWLDNEVYDMASKAEGEKNPGEHFQDLFHGRWVKWHQSQSQADIALVNMLSFFSRNPEQIKRMFFTSELGQRTKAHRGPTKNRLSYIDEMIQKSFDNMPPELDIGAIMGNLEKQLATEKAKAVPPSMFGNDLGPAPGLMGLIEDYIYRSAPRPVREIARAAAIGLMAGIAGRAYNYSNTGLNSYVLVIAHTGCGKEAMKGGISRLMKAVADPNMPNGVPVAMDFIGPASIASGQALVKYLGRNACFVSIIGEFGLMLQNMCAIQANASEINKRQVLLDLYNKSGINDTLQETIYSDKDKTTSVVDAPSMTILGESSPTMYFPYITEQMVAQGLIPRFTTIEYKGQRPAANKDHAKVKPSELLLGGMVQLITNSLTLQQHKRAIEVQTDVAGLAALDEFDRYCDEKHKSAEIDVARDLWSRAHVKLFKLASLVAVGIHPYAPVITEEYVKWARQIIEADVINIIQRFDAGTVGLEANEQQQRQLAIDTIKDYLLRPYDGTLIKYGIKMEFHRDKIVPWGYLQMRLCQKTAFKKDRMGPTIALKRCIDNMILDGGIAKINALVMQTRYDSTAQAYAVTSLSSFQPA